MGNVTQFFGENPAMYQRIGLHAHNGIDLVAEWDSPLYAVEDATVIGVKRAPDGYGRHVRLLGRSRSGVCNEWTYGHCEQILVTLGQKVKAGEQIATMGNTGFVVSTAYANGFWGVSPAKPTHPGTHLHLGLRKVVRDPKGFSYEGSSIKIRVLNYDNGYKGAVDPVPELTKNNSTSDEEKQLETIGLLQRVVELYKQLLAIKK
jgi:murein DD-endopeptidase MepM/ murein hydrolase activator NlpD